ncbi:MAG: transposase, partial [Oscillospiraceae bacterium]|nr:transposase [Oscillospiraceae bacterium]
EWDTRGKRSPSTQPGVTAPDVRHKREAWKQTISPEMIDRLVFLDESGINTDMTPIYGFGIGFFRVSCYDRWTKTKQKRSGERP